MVLMVSLGPVKSFSMPKYQIKWKAELTNITEIKPFNEEEFEWIFTVMCTNCHEEHPNEISFRLSVKNL